MRNLKIYAQGELSETQIIKGKTSSLSKREDVKKVLNDCKEILLELNLKSEKLENEVKEKDKVIGRLIEDKQKYQLHMSNCDSQYLKKKFEEEQLKQQSMCCQMKEIAEKYEKIIDKNNAQITKIKGYNRALRVENAHLRQKQETAEKKNRKIGMISSSCAKDRFSSNSFEITQINTNNEEQIRQRSIQMIFQTPQPLKSLKSANLPSTEHSVPLSTENRWKSKELPQNLFKNQVIRQFQVENGEQSSRRSQKSSRNMKVNKIVKKIKDLLADSDEDEI